jgi:hypothetical protein
MLKWSENMHRRPFLMFEVIVLILRFEVQNKPHSVWE